MKKKGKKRNNKPHGHYCRICGQHKAHEKFSGKGHASHICKACHSLPVARRNEMEIINKIGHIEDNFFISKENLKRLKKYANDKRYPESSKYAQEALDSFYSRMDEYHGNNIKTALTEPVFYSELNDSQKAEVREMMEEHISEFIGFNCFIPDNDDMEEILDRICEEISESLNYYEPEPFSPAAYYGDLYTYEPDMDFEINEIEEQLAKEIELEGEEFYDDEDEEEEAPDIEEPEKELTPDDSMRNLFNEILEEIIKECREDGFDPPTFLDTLIVAETDRLKIRKFILNDLDSLWEIMKKDQVMYAWERGFKKKEVKKWLREQLTRYNKDGYGYFAVILKESGKLIGQTGLIKTDINGEEVVEIGYIFDNSVWKQGYCIEAAKAFAEMAFNDFGIFKLYCTVRPDNEPSINVAKKLGMTESGEFIKIFDEKEIPHLIYVLCK